MSAPMAAARHPLPNGLHGADDDVADDGQEDDAPKDQAPEGDQGGGGKRGQRERAQAAEARAVAAEERLTRLQRQGVARLAGAVLAEGADVLETALGGVELDDLLDPETGMPDADLVAAAAAAVVAARPGLKAARRASAGSVDGGARDAPPRRTTWGQAVAARL